MSLLFGGLGLIGVGIGSRRVIGMAADARKAAGPPSQPPPG
ncbi:hypothetical protein AB0D08_05960 [Kitasatospora sp. NPDC048540]|nr:hypothetical protein [Kitasatospora sp. MBT63]